MSPASLLTGGGGGRGGGGGGGGDEGPRLPPPPGGFSWNQILTAGLVAGLAAGMASPIGAWLRNTFGSVSGQLVLWMPHSTSHHQQGARPGCDAERDCSQVCRDWPSSQSLECCLLPVPARAVPAPAAPGINLRCAHGRHLSAPCHLLLPLEPATLHAALQPLTSRPRTVITFCLPLGHPHHVQPYAELSP